nr:MAG TPA_asm: hypothetical protein [Caudoviricetes sp.]
MFVRVRSDDRAACHYRLHIPLFRRTVKAVKRRAVGGHIRDERRAAASPSR